MKIHFNPKDFLPRLRLARNAVAASNRTPILQNIKIVAKQTSFGAVLQAANGELGIRVHVDCDVEEDGVVLLPAKEFIDTLASIKEKQMGLELIDEDAVLKWDGEEYGALLTVSPDRFIDVPDFVAEAYHEIPTEAMQELIRRTVFATTKDNMRYALAGVCFEADEESIDAVAIDGHCMAWQRSSGKMIGNPVIKSAVVPAEALKLLDKILKNKSFFHWEVVHMAVAEDHVLFQGEDFSLFSRSCVGTFPQWRSHVPNTKATACATVNCGELSTAMDSLQAVVKGAKKPEVAMIFEQDSLTLEAQKTKTEKMTFVIHSFFNGRAVVRINPVRLTAMLKLLDAGTNLSIHLSSDDPVMVKTADNFTYLATPYDVEVDVKPEVEVKPEVITANKPVKATAGQHLLPTFTAERIAPLRKTAPHKRRGVVQHYREQAKCRVRWSEPPDTE